MYNRVSLCWTPWDRFKCHTSGGTFLLHTRKDPSIPNMISGGWNRGVPLYTEVSSFQGIGIQEFYCIERCPYFRGLE